MFDELIQKATKRMEDSIHSLERDLESISTGRANPKLLDAVKVEVYGSMMPIDQVGTVSVLDSSTLSIQIWDTQSVKPTEKAIINANLGYNPAIDGNLIRIAIPKLSEERRVEMVKLAKKYGEDKKISIRNIRRDTLDDFKKNENEIGKDQAHSFSDEVQKLTDKFTGIIDEHVSAKEKDLTTI